MSQNKEELTIDKGFSYSGLIHLSIISKLSDKLSSNFTYITIKICSNIMFEQGERTNKIYLTKSKMIIHLGKGASILPKIFRIFCIRVAILPCS
jgi:hypothetical protein